MRFILLSGLLLCWLMVPAQARYGVISDVPVSEDGDLLSDPWTGGYNAVQVNMLDFTGDGHEDIVLFERFMDGIKLLAWTNNGWKYSPQYLPLFPEVSRFLLLRDLNGDGKKDLITYHPLGMMLYLNTTQGELSFRPFNHGNEIQTSGVLGPVNISMNPDDVPAIADVDHDGLPDILSIGFLTNTVSYSHNISTQDTVMFESVTTNWGDFEDCGCGLYAYSMNCDELGGRIEHAGAKSLLALDLNNDQALELVISEEDCFNLFRFWNEGTPGNDILRNADHLFPSFSRPIFMPTFPAAYYEDIDGDGDRDLIISTNSTSSRGYIQLDNKIHFYRNVGTETSVNFRFEQEDYLIDQTIDLGENAVPVFFDYDNDGDKDMIVGRVGEYGAWGQVGSLYLYRNIGDRLDPSFELVSRDWLKLSLLNFRHIRPQFADVNSDGIQDLLIHASTPLSPRSRMYYLINESFWKLDISEINETGIETGLSDKVLMHDLDQDGDLDLILIRENGAIEWYERTPGSYESMGTFYGFEADGSHRNPDIQIADTDDNGRDDLIVSDRFNGIQIYRDFKDDLENPVAPEEVEYYGPDDRPLPGFRPGSNLHVSVADLFNDDLPSLVLGTGEGGLMILRNRDAIQGPTSDLFELSPTLVRGATDPELSGTTHINMAFQLLNLNGQELTPLIKVPSGSDLHHNLPGLSQGLYLVRIFTGPSEFKTFKLVVAR